MQNIKQSTQDETMAPLPDFDHVQELLKLNVIQVDKSKSDYSALEEKLNSLNTNKSEIIFVADKKDIDDKNQKLKFITIDYNRFKNRQAKHTATTSKDIMFEPCETKSDILDFVKKYL